ncbi:hypothetical protein B0H66DRAFT_529939 [Apodospora peruviana]|uniref:Zn(2)-C6 fungal-type domain-containing protein n=1 Tax=Apodospora peruviana TaxID=516989 RepID=A0AAE0IJ77_9PEZI|nr:hypothetical protein B0H66DRAFT_529939 [Apodospora peruviana]
MTLTFSNLCADSFESQLRAGRKRPRVREYVSCWQCRSRKIRCDRESPCNRCQERGIASDCLYLNEKYKQSPEGPRQIKEIRKFRRSSDSECTPSRLQVPYEPPSQCQGMIKIPPDSSHDEDFQEKINAAMDTRGSAQMSTGNNTIRESGSRSRIIGISHWLAPCYEMTITKALLDQAPEFESSRKEFSDVKRLIRTQNNLAPAAGSSAGFASFWSLFPDRQACLRLAAQYFRTYNRVYNIVDHADISRDISRIYSGDLDDSLRIGKVILVIALTMQHVESERLNGRWLAKQVEACIGTSRRFQKPCTEVAQLILLIILLKTVAASETDDMFDLRAVHDLTSQIANSMGLHRDPSFYPNTPYHSELRKRTWACLLRLNLEYCIRSGFQFTLPLDESDCPLPETVDLRALDPMSENDMSSFAPDNQATADMVFGIAAAKLARIVAPVHRALYSPNPTKSPELLQSDLRAAFEQLLAELPPGLRPGSQSTDPVEELQQSIISIHINSFLSIVALGSTFGTPPSTAQRSVLMEVWDYGTMVLHQFQNLFQRTQEVGNMTRHLLWTDASRAALGGCWIIWTTSTAQPRTGHDATSTTDSLHFLEDTWQVSRVFVPALAGLFPSGACHSKDQPHPHR